MSIAEMHLRSWAEVDAAAANVGFGQRPLKIPRAGGSLPDGAFAVALGIPVFSVPYGSPDQRNHAPNENMRLDHILKGTRTSAALFPLLAETLHARGGSR